MQWTTTKLNCTTTSSLSLSVSVSFNKSIEMSPSTAPIYIEKMRATTSTKSRNEENRRHCGRCSDNFHSFRGENVCDDDDDGRSIDCYWNYVFGHCVKIWKLSLSRGMARHSATSPTLLSLRMLCVAHSTTMMINMRIHSPKWYRTFILSTNDNLIISVNAAEKKCRKNYKK